MEVLMFEKNSTKLTQFILTSLNAIVQGSSTRLHTFRITDN